MFNRIYFLNHNMTFSSSMPDPNDGRFDDIDDEDPMEGVEIPKIFLKREKNEKKKEIFLPCEDLFGYGNSSTTKPKSLFGTSSGKTVGLKNNKDNFQQSTKRNRNRLLGSKHSLDENAKKSLSFEFLSLFKRYKPQDEDFQPKYKAKLNIENSSNWQRDEKYLRTNDDPTEKKFEQPTKVKTVEVDPQCHYPDEFLHCSRSGQGRYERGYCKIVKPMDHDLPKPQGHTRFVCISDTHNEHRNLKLPPGDVLLHCGDFSLAGELKEIDEFNEWLGEVPFKHKVVIAGNHELSFDQKIMEHVELAKKNNSYVRFGKYLKPIEEKDWRNIRSRLTNCTYLEDSEIMINGIRIWGSPWQPEFGNWGFNLTRGRPLMEKWNKIPNGVDILMTHGPPAGHGDRVVSGQRVGCVDLLNTVQLRVQPKYHLFGHIHEGYGLTTDQFTTYINCSSVDYHYDPGHPPIVFDMPNKA
ncbi:metallophosphoesterase MPPED2-like isoform X1 [Styela clava]